MWLQLHTHRGLFGGFRVVCGLVGGCSQSVVVAIGCTVWLWHPTATAVGRVVLYHCQGSFRANQPTTQLPYTPVHPGCSLLPSLPCLQTAEKSGSGLTYIPPAKPKLPGHEESYNPPKEYLPTGVCVCDACDACVCMCVCVCFVHG